MRRQTVFDELRKALSDLEQALRSLGALVGEIQAIQQEITGRAARKLRGRQKGR